MRKFKFTKYTSIALVLLAAITSTNCSVRVDRKPKTVYRSARPLPPGQAKKVYGVKSARGFAPGHNKKS